jgi:hypothetical protein
LSKAFDASASAFATREARDLGVDAGWSSFAPAVAAACEGAGEVVVEMHFLDDLRASISQRRPLSFLRGCACVSQVVRSSSTCLTT